MRSIRNRILLLVLGLLGISLPMISYKSYLDARHETEELFDAQLAQSTRLLSGMIHRNMDDKTRLSLQRVLDEAILHLYTQDEDRDDDDDKPSKPLPLPPSNTHLMLQGHPYESKVSFQVFTPEGKTILRSASAPETALSTLLAQHAAQGDLPADPKIPFNTPHIKGYHYLPIEQHLWRLFLLYDQQDDLWILAGERNDIREELTQKIAQRNLLPDLIGLPLLALLVWLAVNCGLRPLEQMVNLLKARDPDNLSPLLLEPLPKELEPMAASLNRLLAQVHHLLEREKRFLADAAHELRTPLAVLRIHQQNALAAQTEQDRQEALEHLGKGVERATRVVSQLLTLARLEPNAVQLNRQPLDMLAFVREELAQLIPLALERQQELILDAEEYRRHELSVDAGSMGILLQNLISNAIQYTPTGGSIRVSLQILGQQLLLGVEDSGPGVSAELRDKLFERFFRLGVGQGAGLGLSIVARIVELHRGTVELGESETLGGFAVWVRLPRD